MTRSPSRLSLLMVPVLFALISWPQAAQAAEYELDVAHTSIYFRIMHAGVSQTYGRFNDFSGSVVFDGDKSKFDFTVKTDSVDTGLKKRDDHLRSPDFFNAKQFPVITAKTTGVKQSGDNYELTVDLTLHGVTKSVTVPLKFHGETEFPKGMKRIGFSTEFTIKRSEFGMDKMVGPVGDDVDLMVSFEATRK